MNTHDMQSSGISEPEVSSEHPELFHYTSIPALRGILETNTLWATQAAHLNDSSELTILWPIVEKKFEQYIADSVKDFVQKCPEIQDNINSFGGIDEIAHHDASSIIETMKSLLFGSEEQLGMAVPFVTSFSTHASDYIKRNGMLSQWRGYGGDNNVAIEFDTKGMETILKFEYSKFEYSSCSIGTTVYYMEEVNLVNRFPNLFRAIRNFSRQMPQLSESDSDDNVSENILRELSSTLVRAAGRLKHQAFSEEKECRILAAIPDKYHRESLEKHGGGGVQIKKIHYREGAVGSIPYIRLFDELDIVLPITRIIIGPSRNQLANLEVVGSLMENICMETSKIRIECSDIPFVGST